jgi:hypothetical protein
MFDPMSELSGGSSSSSTDDGGVPAKTQASSGGGGNGRFAKDLHSITIHARQRTFYIDLKESGNGKFFKISEKSRGGQKTTIMFDAEDITQFIDALTEMKGQV